MSKELSESRVHDLQDEIYDLLHGRYDPTEILAYTLDALATLTLQAADVDALSNATVDKLAQLCRSAKDAALGHSVATPALALSRDESDERRHSQR